MATDDLATHRTDPTAHDHQLRAVLKLHLQQRNAGRSTLMVDEMALAYGSVRADLVVVSELLEGFEIKAGNDTLKRMPAQMQAYDATFDRCSVVTVQSHLAKVLTLVPSWWGVLLVDNTPSLHVYREPRDNPMLDAAQLVRLLWREEALAKLDAIGQLKGYKTKPKLALFAKLVDCVALPELRDYVRSCLRARTQWRDADGSSMLKKQSRSA